VDVLGDRGLAGETLVVYTSDHGELLGEYGFFGHTHLATPEIVYVPTTFPHPTLEPSAESSLLHHVDFLPTVASALGDDVDIGRTHGAAFGGDRTVGYNHVEHVCYESLPNVLETIGDATGGFERAIRSL
jgi:arylsulfatase A-like enzyme